MFGKQVYPTNVLTARRMFQRYRYVPAKWWGIYDFQRKLEGWHNPGKKLVKWQSKEEDRVYKLVYKTHMGFRGPYLDPSAGDGALLDYLCQHCGVDKHDCFAIEIDPDLRAILVNKGYTVIATDWLEANIIKRFGTIVMNPPFAEDAKHLNKALAYAQEHGSNVVALFRQETWDNPRTMEDAQLHRTVKGLQEKLGDSPQVYQLEGDYNRDGSYERGDQRRAQKQTNWPGICIERFGNCFAKDARRTTNEPVACLRLQQYPTKSSGFFDEADFEIRDFVNVLNEGSEADNSALALRGMIPALVAQYQGAERELKALLIAQRRLGKLCQGLSSGFFEQHSDVGKADTQIHAVTDPEAAYSSLRQRFWNSVFNRINVAEKMPYEFIEEWERFQQENKLIDFTVGNVQQVLVTFFSKQDEIMTRVGLKLFDAIAEHSSDNQVPWKTYKSNDAFKLREQGRIIYPTSLNSRTWSKYGSNGSYFMRDLERFLCWLTGKDITKIDVFEKAWRDRESGSNTVVCWVGKVRWYGNGNVHAYLKKELVQQFNRFVGEQRKWLDTADASSCAKQREKNQRSKNHTTPVGSTWKGDPSAWEKNKAEFESQLTFL